MNYEQQQQLIDMLKPIQDELDAGRDFEARQIARWSRPLPHHMTAEQLQREAVALQHKLHDMGKRDESYIVIELANRLMRLQPVTRMERIGHKVTRITVALGLIGAALSMIFQGAPI